MQPSVFTVTLLLSTTIRVLCLVHDPSWSCPWDGLLFLLFHRSSSSPSLPVLLSLSDFVTCTIVPRSSHSCLIYCAVTSFRLPACFPHHAFVCFLPLPCYTTHTVSSLSLSIHLSYPLFPVFLPCVICAGEKDSLELHIHTYYVYSWSFKVILWKKLTKNKEKRRQLTCTPANTHTPLILTASKSIGKLMYLRAALSLSHSLTPHLPQSSPCSRFQPSV